MGPLKCDSFEGFLLPKSRILSIFFLKHNYLSKYSKGFEWMTASKLRKKIIIIIILTRHTLLFYLMSIMLSRQITTN